VANERAIADANSVAERLREETEKAPRPVNSAALDKQAPQEKQEKAAAQGPQEKQDGKAGSAQIAVAEATNLREGIARVLQEVGLAQGPKLDVRVVDDGILISLTDDMSFGMFAVGSAEPQPRVVRAMEKIGALLAPQPGSFIIRGHTDARAYKSRAYDNWRLSAARAQMAAYMLMRGKLDEKRIERIEGHADRALRNTSDPLAAENRRIEILLRRTK
jgi:chemotaxis protein MotB